jgi:hypothetical protein
MLADQLDYVVGADPHRDVHALAVVEVRTGGVVSGAMVDQLWEVAAAYRVTLWEQPARPPDVDLRRAGWSPLEDTLDGRR